MLKYGLIGCLKKSEYFCQTPVLGLGLGVDFTFARDNNKNKNAIDPYKILLKTGDSGYELKGAIKWGKHNFFFGILSHLKKAFYQKIMLIWGGLEFSLCFWLIYISILRTTFINSFPNSIFNVDLAKIFTELSAPDANPF